MTCWISRAMSSKLDCSSCFVETSLYSAWSTDSRSPSSVSAAPVVSLMVCMSGSEAFDGAGLIGMGFDEVLRARHGEHRLDPFLDAGELQRAPGGAGLPVEVHQAADRRAVDVADGREVDDHASLARGEQLLHRRRELRQEGVHQAGFPDSDDRDTLGVFGRDVHQILLAPRLRGRTG